MVTDADQGVLAIPCPAWQDAASPSDDEVEITFVRMVRKTSRNVAKSERGAKVKQEGGTDRKEVFESVKRPWSLLKQFAHDTSEGPQKMFAAVPDISELIFR